MTKKFYHISRYNLQSSSESSENSFLQNPSGSIIPTIYNQTETKHKWNNTIIYIVIGSVFTIILAAVIIIILTRSTDYEHGVLSLHANDLNAALTEFQKIAPDDRMYEMAQSKINYINGLNEYNKGNYEVSKNYLSKVDESDEYYPDTRLMLDRIAMSSRTANLNSILEKVKKVKDAAVQPEK
ncbi:MAG: hypothetical protein ABSF32_00795 [Ignavibacteria bacterium]|jgi:hypothetical protein